MISHQLPVNQCSLWLFFIYNLRNQWCLWTKKMQNEPNFLICKIASSVFSTTGYCSLMTGNCIKNEPNRTQFSSLFPLWQKKAKNGVVLDNFGVFLAHFGVVLDKFGIVWAHFGNTKTAKSRIFSTKNAENTNFASLFFVSLWQKNAFCLRS